MTLLEEIYEAVHDCKAAAWVDLRTGALIEQHAPQSDPYVAIALDAATEVMRSRERPPRMVLLSAEHVHIIQRTVRDPYRVLVVICARSPNLGLAISLVRSLLKSEESS
jgi:hypothetical protein